MKTRANAPAPPTPYANEPLLVDLKHAAYLLGSTVWTVRGLLWDKKIPHVKIGRRFLVDVSDLRVFIADLKSTA